MFLYQVSVILQGISSGVRKIKIYSRILVHMCENMHKNFFEPDRILNEIRNDYQVEVSSNHWTSFHWLIRLAQGLISFNPQCRFF